MNNKYFLILLFFLAIGFTSHAQWTAMNGPYGGQAQDLEVDGTNKLYTVINQKIYTSTNEGTSWAELAVTTPSPSNFYVDDMLIDGANLYALYYYILQKSTDGGSTWTKVNLNTTAGQFYGVQKIVKVANNVFAIYGWNGAYVSVDAGETWTKIDNNEVTSLVKNNAGDIFLADKVGIRKHAFSATAAGWAESNLVTVHARADDYSLRLFAKPGSTVIFASAYDDLLKSTTGNVGTFSSIKLATGDSYFYYSAWTYNTADTKVYLANNATRKIISTTNDGVGWSTATPSTAWPSITQDNAGINNILFTSATKGFVATSGNAVWMTSNTGAAWSQVSAGLNFPDGRNIELTNTGKILLQTWYSRGYWGSTNGGSTWTFQQISANETFNKLFKMPNGTTFLAYYGGPVHYSTDGAGTTWSNVGTTGEYFNDMTFNTTASLASTNVYACAYNRVATSTTGTTWTNVAITGLPVTYNADRIARDDGGFIYLYLYNYTTSKNEMWKITLSNATTGTAVQLSVPLTDNDYYPNGFFVNNNKVYYASYQTVFMSADQGATWNSISFSNNGLFGLVDGARKGIAASQYGTMYVTQDDGQTWVSAGLPSTNTFIQDITVDAAGDFYAASYNYAAIKNTGTLLVDPAALPEYINFNWQPTNGPYGGNIQQLMVDGSSNTYAFNNGQILKTTTFASWASTTSLPNGDYMTEVDNSSTTIYGTGYNSLYSSANGGTSWTTLNNENLGSRYLVKRMPNGNIIQIAWDGSAYKVYISTDGGTTFGASKYAFANDEGVNSNQGSIQVSSTNVIYIRYFKNSVGTKFKRSTDGGTTWTDMTLQNNHTGFISTDGSGNIYNVQPSDIYKSTDNGVTWTSIKGDYAGFHNSQARIYANGSNLYLPGRTNSILAGIWKSANGGTNWTFQTNTSIEPNSTISVRDLKWVGTRMVVACNLGIFVSDDDGVTFTSKNVGITGLNYSDLELASPTSLIAQANSGFRFNSSDLQNWTRGTQSFTKYLRKPDGTLIAFNCSQIWQSNDAGATFTKISDLPNGCITEIATLDGISYYAAVGSYIYYSTNLTSWTELAPTGLPDVNNRGLNDIAIDNNGILYVTLYNYSTSQNEAYQILFGSGVKINGLTNPNNIEYRSNKIIIYDSNGKILSTTDGSIWTQNSAPGGDRLIIASNNYYFVPVGGGKLWLSRDQGTTWQNVGLTGSGASNMNFRDVVVNEYNGYAYAAIDGSVVRKSAVVVVPNDNANPLVTTLSPAHNSTGASVKPSISITFDEAVVPVAAKKIRILDLASPISPLELIDATAGVQNGKTFTFTPSVVLDYNKTYFIIVDNGSFTDIFGNAFAGITANTTWRFTTKLAPTLNTLAPANGATGVSLTTSLALTYSEPAKAVATKHLYIYDATAPSSPLNSITFAATTDEFAWIHPDNGTADQSIKLRFDATKGGKELMGAAKVYAHLGLNDNWAHAKGNWGLDDGIGQMTKVAGETNIWEITLGPTLRSYFGADPSLVIETVNMVFRNADGSVKAVPPSTVANGTVDVNGDVFLNIDPSATPNCSSAPQKSGNTITISPCVAFEFGKQYFAKFEAGALTTSDGGIVTMPTANTDWVFTMRAAPTVSTLTPANNATLVNINTTLQATFSEALIPVNGKTLSIYKVSAPGTAIETLSVAGNASGNSITYTLASALEFNVQYFVKFDANSFKTSDGGTVSPLTGDTDWRFTTALAPDVEDPVITFTAPATFTKGATNKISATITDNRDIASTKIEYRGILSTGSFVQADLVKNVSTGAYEVTVADAWLDEMGLEYRLIAVDGAGNDAISPSAGEHQTRITFTDADAPTLPSLPAGGTVGSYRIIAVPHELSNTAVATVFSELGEPDNKLFRFLTYDNAKEDWSEYPGDFTTITRGVGYFINMKNPSTLKVEGAKTPANTKTTSFSFNLKPGWNLIGNPFPFAISTAPITAANSSLGGVKSYNGNYQPASTLAAFEGGFIFNSGASQITATLAVSAKAGREKDVFDDGFAGGWKVPIKVTQGERENNFGGVGMHPEASASFDRFDDVTPPRFNEYVDIQFAHPEHKLKHFARDIVPTADEYVWEFKVDSNTDGEAILTWDNSMLPENGEIYLLDVGRNLPINMAVHSTHTFNPAESRMFKVYYGENVQAKMLPDKVTLGSVYPNPSNGIFAIFAFSLPESGGNRQHVRLELTDVLGRPVALVKEGTFTAGYHEVKWESFREKLSDGLYMFRMNVNHASGNENLNGKLTIKQ